MRFAIATRLATDVLLGRRVFCLTNHGRQVGPALARSAPTYIYTTFDPA